MVESPPCASVAVGRPVAGPFTYLLPAGHTGPLLPGQRLLVPFGRGRALGFYLGPAAPPAGAVLKPIAQVLEMEPALPPDVFRLLAFAAAHYRYPLGEALRAALPPGLTRAVEDTPVAAAGVMSVVATEAADPAVLRRAPAQAAALGYLLAVGGRADVDELVRAVPGARAAVRQLQSRGFVRVETLQVAPLVGAGFAQGRPASLTEGQQRAVQALTGALDASAFRPFLLQGVTGSGKTEVYLRAAEHALASGKGALVLVPEIALTPQLVGRFRGRFGAQVAVLHSGLSDRERRVDWQALRAGRVRLAVGVRSAVFAPVAALGLLVVDEEHDPSFKQDEKLRYQARDLAVVRARDLGAVVVLGSATPSLESYENARRGRYQLLELPARRSPRRAPWRCPRRWPAGNRPSSSSTAAGTAPPWCARPAVSPCPARSATSPSPCTWPRRPCSATTAAPRMPSPRCAAAVVGRCCVWAVAPRGWRPRCKSAAPRRGWRGWTGTASAPESASPSGWPPSPAASWTCWWARRW